eukprot:SAG11_NODE_33982_length_274_cov_0.880000_1_plen_61_part_01
MIISWLIAIKSVWQATYYYSTIALTDTFIRYPKASGGLEVFHSLLLSSSYSACMFFHDCCA